MIVGKFIKMKIKKQLLNFRLQSARNIVPVRNLIGTKPPRSINNEKHSDDDDPNKPILFFGSAAEQIRATPIAPERPYYTPYIVNISLMVFLIYFCILREENDIDEILGRDLYENFGDEAARLKKAYDYNIKNNLPTAEIVNRLREIGAPAPPRV